MAWAHQFLRYILALDTQTHAAPLSWVTRFSERGKHIFNKKNAGSPLQTIWTCARAYVQEDTGPAADSYEEHRVDAAVVLRVVGHLVRVRG